jgi:hypothetical protein
MDTFAPLMIPIILIVAGLIFLFAAIFGGLGSFASLPRTRQPLAGAAGIVLLLAGIGLYLLPVEMPQIRTLHASAETSGEIFAVDARREWQSTGMMIERGATLSFTVIDGQWTNWKGFAPYTMGEGTSYICGGAHCVEYLPNAPTGALIGRVGDHVFHIGQGRTIFAETGGTLALAINDAPSGLYDNDGVLTVRVSLELN